MMGMSWKDAADWDFVEYSAALSVWNDRHAEKDANGETIDAEPPPIEWMMADDVLQHARGHKVN